LKQFFRWIAAVVASIIWGYVCLLSAATWSMSGFVGFLNEPLTLSPSGETIVNEIPEHPSFVLLGLITLGLLVAAVVLALLLESLLKRRGPALFALTAGPLGAFAVELSWAIEGLKVDPPGLHSGDILGMAPVELLSLGILFLVPATAGALTITWLTRNSHPTMTA